VGHGSGPSLKYRCAGLLTGVIAGMASEILSVPEENLEEVIQVILAGLKAVKVSAETRRALTKWCKEEVRYLRGGDDDEA